MTEASLPPNPPAPKPPDPASPTPIPPTPGESISPRTVARSLMLAALALDFLGLAATHGWLDSWPKGLRLPIALWVGWLSLGTAAAVFFTPSRLGRTGWLVWCIVLHWFLLGSIQVVCCAIERYNPKGWFMTTTLTRFLDAALLTAIALRAAALGLSLTRWDRLSRIRLADGIPSIGDAVGLGAIAAVAIYSLFQIGMIGGADAVFHVSTIYGCAQNDAMAMWMATGHNNHPNYSVNLWHAVLAILTRLSGVPTPVLWINSFWFVIPVAFVFLCWTVRRMFDREKVSTWAILGSLALFLAVALIFGCTPGTASPPHLSFFTFGMWTWAYNQNIFFLYVLGPSLFFAGRWLKEARWEDAAALGLLLSVGYSIHILGAIILSLLLVVWYLAGVALPPPGTRRLRILLTTLAVAVLPLPRLLLVGFNIWTFTRSGGAAPPQVSDDVVQMKIAGLPAQIFYFYSVLFLLALCAINWRELRWRLLGLSVLVYFVILLIPAGKEWFTRHASFVITTRMTTTMTFLVWLLGPCLLWQTIRGLLEQVAALRGRAWLPPLIATAASGLILWGMLHAWLPYRNERLKRLVGEIRQPFAGRAKRTSTIKAGETLLPLVAYFRGRNEVVHFHPGGVDVWTLLFWTGRSLPPGWARSDLAKEISKPPPWKPDVFTVPEIRLFLVKDDPVLLDGLRASGYRREGSWTHPTLGRYDLLVWPKPFKQ